MIVEQKEMPEIVRIELADTCNLQCPQCRHSEPKKLRSKEIPVEMKIWQLAKIVDEITPFRPSVTLNVANEPLIAKTFTKAISQIKKRELATTFNTNGLALTEDIAHLLVDIFVDSVNFSIDAVTPQTLKKVRGIDCMDRIIDNIELMIRIRGRKSLPRIGATFVRQKENCHEISDFLEFWKRRVDVIRVCEFIAYDAPKLSGMGLPTRIPCKQLFRDMVIRANGDVSPCVICASDPNISAGNIFTDGGVKAVWNGKSLNEMRALHNSGRWSEMPICGKCDYWMESCDVKEEEREGFLIRYASPYTVYYNVVDKMKNWNRELHDRIGVLTT